MIKGRRHVWCNKVNWDNEDKCSCPVFSWPKDFAKNYPDAFMFTDVFFNHERLESLAKEMKEVFEQVGLKNIYIDYDPSYEAFNSAIGAIIVDDWLAVYTGIYYPGFCIDVLINEGEQIMIKENITAFATIKTLAQKVFNNILENVMIP